MEKTFKFDTEYPVGGEEIDVSKLLDGIEKPPGALTELIPTEDPNVFTLVFKYQPS